MQHIERYQEKIRKWKEDKNERRNRRYKRYREMGLSANLAMILRDCELSDEDIEDLRKWQDFANKLVAEGYEAESEAFNRKMSEYTNKLRRERRRKHD